MDAKEFVRLLNVEICNSFAEVKEAFYNTLTDTEKEQLNNLLQKFISLKKMHNDKLNIKRKLIRKKIRIEALSKYTDIVKVLQDLDSNDLYILDAIIDYLHDKNYKYKIDAYYDECSSPDLIITIDTGKEFSRDEGMQQWLEELDRMHKEIEEAKKIDITKSWIINVTVKH